MNDKVENAAQDPQKFDWVTKRSSCSIPKVFKDLRVQVEEDVKIRNGLRPSASPYEFSLTQEGAYFSVLLTAKDVRKSVFFRIGEHAIVVQDDQGKRMFEVTLTFNDHGQCKLFVNDEEREMWQVCRMALEDLMFRGY